MFHLGTELSHLRVLCSSRLETVPAPRRCSYSDGEVSCFQLAWAWLRCCFVLQQKPTTFLTRSTETGRMQHIYAGSCCSFADERPAAPAKARHQSIEMNRTRSIHAGSCCSFADERPAAPATARHRSVEMHRTPRIRAGSCCSFADGRPAAPATARHRSVEMRRTPRIRAGSC